MIEQPLAAGDLVDHAKLQKRLKTAICLDESITSLRDARHALELDACRIINIKLGRVGGHSEAKAIQKFASHKDIPVWCGGMLESGIGRSHNIAMSTLDGFCLPGDVPLPPDIGKKTLSEPEIFVCPNGTITPSENPGIGYEVDEQMIKTQTVRAENVDL